MGRPSLSGLAPESLPRGSRFGLSEPFAVRRVLDVFDPFKQRDPALKAWLTVALDGRGEVRKHNVR